MIDEESLSSPIEPFTANPRLSGGPTDSRNGPFEIKIKAVEVDDSKEDVEESKLYSQTDTQQSFVKPKERLPAPMPILPKPTSVFLIPPKCPLENVNFILLKKFANFTNVVADKMSVGYDLVGNRRKMITIKTEEKIKNRGGAANYTEPKQEEPEAKIDDTTHFIKNIVFARDQSIFNQETGLVP